jgi:hypothetical protein
MYGYMLFLKFRPFKSCRKVPASFHAFQVIVHTCGQLRMKLCFVSESGEGNYESFLNTENDPCVFAKLGDDITFQTDLYSARSPNTENGLA